ncbi:MAG: phosphoenolpyruvate--protein phosphotransferase [Candidatus Eiseniibacteriota bacterium]|jgi:phosphotransferase system enzyme I (PtsI)
MSETRDEKQGTDRPAAAGERVPSGHTPDEIAPRFDVPTDRPHISQRGRPASPGIAIGVVRLHTYRQISVRPRSIPAARIDEEIARFNRAIDKARQEVSFLRDSVAKELGEEQARIFDAQLLFFEDVMVIEGTVRDLRAERLDAAAIFRRNVNRMIQRLRDADSDYLRDRGEDFQDAKRRVLRHLLDIGTDGDVASGHRPGTVLVARDLAPSEAAALDPTRTKGLLTEGGTLVSHAAIMARAKGIPCVIGLKGILRYVQNGDIAAFDGATGVVEFNPPRSTLAGIQRRLNEFRAHENQLSDLRDERAVTLDGHEITLAANIESPADIGRVRERGAAGVGLYRTEFFYIDRARMPSEEEQAEAYGQVAEQLKPLPVIIRTMDVGGDKVASYLGTDREANPFLGWRGIRFSLERRDVFRTQLRAIYRASVHGNVRIMLPMIVSIEEVRSAREVALDVKAELAAEGVPIAPEVEIGIMIETPAAVAMADLLARECDFFSVGSNDLIQYTLAIDRTNPKIAHMYEPLHPAILRSLRTVVEAGRQQSIWVGVCGEMASDPLAAVLLVGMGFSELSMTPLLVPEIKAVVRAISLEEARQLVDEATALDTGDAIRAMVRARVGHRLPQFLLP